MHRNNILVYKSQQDAHVTDFILSDNCSTYFGLHYHPQHTHISSNSSTIAADNSTVERLPDAVVTVFCAPEDG